MSQFQWTPMKFGIAQEMQPYFKKINTQICPFYFQF